MAEATTIARPYAEALFKLALEHNRFQQWSDMLELVAAVAGDPAMQQLIGNPNIATGKLESVLLDICGSRLDAQGRNFLQVLVENRRLAVLPEIKAQYRELVAQHEGVLHARIHSALAIDDAQLGQLVSELEAKYRHKISATVDVDPALIGGAKIVVGDKVLDATVRGRLNAMAAALAR